MINKLIKPPQIKIGLSTEEDKFLSQHNLSVGQKIETSFGILTIIGTCHHSIYPNGFSRLLTVLDSENDLADSLNGLTGIDQASISPVFTNIDRNQYRFLATDPTWIKQYINHDMSNKFPTSNSILNNQTPSVDSLKKSIKDFQNKLDQIRLASKTSALSEVKKTEVAKTEISKTVVSDLTEAGYRILSTQLVKGCQTAAVHSLETLGAGNEKIESLIGLLDTEYGRAVLSMILGMSLTYLPPFQDKPRVAKVAQECRIQSMTLAGNELLSDLMEMLVPVLANALTSIKDEEMLDSETELEYLSTEKFEENIDQLQAKNA